MKAVVLREFGDLECLKVEDLAEPKPQKNEVVIQVYSAALNHLDIWVRKGRPSQEIRKPYILGSDAAGVIVEKGVDTHGVNVGDEVCGSYTKQDANDDEGLRLPNVSKDDENMYAGDGQRERSRKTGRL